jgi:hypothetical protein
MLSRVLIQTCKFHLSWQSFGNASPSRLRWSGVVHPCLLTSMDVDYGVVFGSRRVHFASPAIAIRNLPTRVSQSSSLELARATASEPHQHTSREKFADIVWTSSTHIPRKVCSTSNARYPSKAKASRHWAKKPSTPIGSMCSFPCCELSTWWY